MKFKESRALSFAAIFAIYVLAVAAGVWTYTLLPFDFWLNLLIADSVATVAVFLFSVILNNASVYDPYWSVQPVVILAAFAFATPLSAAGILMLVAVCVWGARLTANWAYTFKGLTFQDWRYTMLKQKTGKFYPIINFVGIHFVPTLIVYGCVLPAVFTMRSAAQPNAGSIVFFVLSLAAVVWQGTADVQMHKFRKHKTGTFIRNGLWRFSRHPNYLAEISVWWTIGLAAVCVLPSRWYLLAGALANTLLFLFVSIPMADGRQSQKEGFEEYKAQTRMLLPIPKMQKEKRG